MKGFVAILFVIHWVVILILVNDLYEENTDKVFYQNKYIEVNHLIKLVNQTSGEYSLLAKKADSSVNISDKKRIYIYTGGLERGQVEIEAGDYDERVSSFYGYELEFNEQKCISHLGLYKP